MPINKGIYMYIHKRNIAGPSYVTTSITASSDITVVRLLVLSGFPLDKTATTKPRSSLGKTVVPDVWDFRVIGVYIGG